MLPSIAAMRCQYAERRRFLPEVESIQVKKREPMNAIEVGQRLIALTTADKDAQALDELYADNVVSVEADGSDGTPDVFEGIAAVREKHEWWNSVATMHEVTAEGPYAAADDNQLAIKFGMDVTMLDPTTEEKARVHMTEIGIFTVEQGKIVREVYLPLVAP